MSQNTKIPVRSLKRTPSNTSLQSNHSEFGSTTSLTEKLKTSQESEQRHITRILKLQKELDQLISENDTFKSQITQHKSEITSHTQTHDNLRNAIFRTELEKDELLKTSKSLEAKITELQSTEKSLKLQIETLQRDQALSYKIENNLNNEITKLKNDLNAYATLKSQHKEKCSEFDILFAGYDDLEKETNLEIHNLKLKIAELEEQVHNSSSYQYYANNNKENEGQSMHNNSNLLHNSSLSSKNTSGFPNENLGTVILSKETEELLEKMTKENASFKIQEAKLKKDLDKSKAILKNLKEKLNKAEENSINFESLANKNSEKYQTILSENAKIQKQLTDLTLKYEQQSEMLAITNESKIEINTDLKQAKEDLAAAQREKHERCLQLADFIEKLKNSNQRNSEHKKEIAELQKIERSKNEKIHEMMETLNQKEVAHNQNLSKLNSLSEEISKQKIFNQEISEKLADLEADRSEMDSNHEKLLSEHVHENQLFKNQISSLKKQEQEINNKIIELDIENSDLEKQVDRLKNQLQFMAEEHRDSLGKLENEKYKVAEEVINKEKELNKELDEKENLERKCEQLNTDMQRILNDKLKSEVENKTLKSKLQETLKKLKIQQNQTTHLNQTKIELEQDLEKLQLEQSRFDHEKSELNLTISNLKQQNDELTHEYTTNNNVKDQAYDTIVSQKKMLQKNLDDMTTAKFSVETLLESKIKELSETNSKLALKESKIEELESAITRRTVEANKSTVELNDKLHKLDSDISKKVEMIKDLEKMLEQHQNEYEQEKEAHLSQISELETKNQNLVIEKDQILITLDAQKHAILELTENNVSFQHRISVLDTKNSGLEERIIVLTDNSNNYQSWLDERRVHCERLEAENISAKNTISNQIEIIDTYKNDIQNLSRQLAIENNASILMSEKLQEMQKNFSQQNEKNLDKFSELYSDKILFQSVMELQAENYKQELNRMNESHKQKNKAVTDTVDQVILKVNRYKSERDDFRKMATKASEKFEREKLRSNQQQTELSTLSERYDLLWAKVKEMNQGLQKKDEQLEDLLNEKMALTNSLADKEKQILELKYKAIQSPMPPPRPAKNPVSFVKEKELVLAKEQAVAASAVGESNQEQNEISTPLKSKTFEEPRFRSSTADFHLMESCIDKTGNAQNMQKSTSSSSFQKPNLPFSITNHTLSASGLPGLKSSRAKNESVSSINSNNNSIISVSGGNNSLVQDEDDNLNSGFGILSSKANKFVSRVGRQESELSTQPQVPEFISTPSKLVNDNQFTSKIKQMHDYYSSPNSDRINELKNRNKKVLPHLQSHYPIETQGRSPGKVDTFRGPDSENSSIQSFNQPKTSTLAQNTQSSNPKAPNSTKPKFGTANLVNLPVARANTFDSTENNENLPPSIEPLTINSKQAETFDISPPTSKKGVKKPILKERNTGKKLIKGLFKGGK